MANLKKRMDEVKGSWADEFPRLLRAMRTTEKNSTGETPFSLACGVDSLIPVEVGEPSLWYAHASEESNQQSMRMELDLLEGRREMDLVHLVTRKRQIETNLNRKAKFRAFNVGDYLKSIKSNDKREESRKIGCKLGRTISN